MREFITPSFPVYMYDVDGNYTVKTIGEVSIHTYRSIWRYRIYQILFISPFIFP